MALPRTVAETIGINGQLTDHYPEAIADLMTDPPLKGFRRIYGIYYGHRVDYGYGGSSYQKLNIMPSTGTNIRLNEFQKITDLGGEALYVFLGASGFMDSTNSDPDDHPLTASLYGTYPANWGGVISANLYANRTYLVADSSSDDEFIIDNSLTATIGDRVRFNLDIRTVTQVDANTPIAGQKTVTVSSNFSTTPLTGDSIFWALNDLTDPNSQGWDEAALIAGMMARVYGSTNDPAGLTAYSSHFQSQTNYTYGPNGNSTGLGVLRWIGIGNEPYLNGTFNEWGDPGDVGGEFLFSVANHAAYVKRLYDTIHAIDPEMNMVINPSWDDGDKDTMDENYTAILSIFGGVWPRKLFLDYHLYSLDSSRTAGAIPEANSVETGVYGKNWGLYGISSTCTGIDSYGVGHLVGECGWCTSPNSNHKTPLLTGLTGTNEEQRQKSQGILLERQAILHLQAKNLINSVIYILTDAADLLSYSAFGTTGIFNQDGSSSPLTINTPKLGKGYVDNILNQIGAFDKYIQRVSEHKAVAISDTQICIMTWDDNAAVTYTKHTKARGTNIFRNILWDLALNASTGGQDAANDVWYAEKGRNAILDGCTYSGGYILPTSATGIQCMISTVNNCEIIIKFEGVNNKILMDTLTSGGTDYFIKIGASGEVLAPFGNDTGLVATSGVEHSIWLWFDGANSKISIDGGTPVTVDMSARNIESSFYIGDNGAKIKNVLVKNGLELSTEDLAAVL